MMGSGSHNSNGINERKVEHSKLGARGAGTGSTGLVLPTSERWCQLCNASRSLEGTWQGYCGIWWPIRLHTAYPLAKARKIFLYILCKVRTNAHETKKIKEVSMRCQDSVLLCEVRGKEVYDPSWAPHWIYQRFIHKFKIPLYKGYLVTHEIINIKYLTIWSVLLFLYDLRQTWTTFTHMWRTLHIWYIRFFHHWY